MSEATASTAKHAASSSGADLDAREAALRAQVSAPPSSAVALVDASQQRTVAEQVFGSPYSFQMIMGCVVLLFGVFSILTAAGLIRRGKTEDSVLRILGTILVVISALFLVVAGYDSQQISPVMGFLGTIVGYLLGKEAGIQAARNAAGAANRASETDLRAADFPAQREAVLPGQH